MSPRRYSMAGRTAQVARTRARIVTAALALYRERGIAGTSMQQVARRADVAPATVLNHFSSADALAEAVVDRIVGSLRMPDDREWTAERTRAARARRLVREMFAFYDRSTPWFELFRGEMGKIPALRRGERRFWAEIGELYARTFGPALEDRRVRGAVFGLTSPATLGALREAGLSVGEASELVGDMLVRRVERAGRGSAR